MKLYEIEYQKGYLQDPWNILDFVVVLSAWLDILPDLLCDQFDVGCTSMGGNVGALKALRLLRALRPLRVISRNQNLKIVVVTLLRSIPQLCNLLILAFFCALLFGLLGVNYKKGGLFTCKDTLYGEYSHTLTQMPLHGRWLSDFTAHKVDLSQEAFCADAENYDFFIVSTTTTTSTQYRSQVDLLENVCLDNMPISGDESSWNDLPRDRNGRLFHQTEDGKEKYPLDEYGNDPAKRLEAMK